MTTRISLTILAMAAIFHSTPVWALGLGDARVQSFIGQPLELQIDLLTSPGDDMASVTARLASAEDFALIGASREAISVPLNFQVREENARSGAHIFVTSRLPLSNPILRLVVEVNWSSGRLLREYTVFLDPPTVPAQAPAPSTAATDRVAPAEPAPEPAPVMAETAPEPEQTETAPPPAAVAQETQVESVSTESQSSSRGTRYGPIEDGQTLWQIASLHMGDSGLDMNQVMMAIQRKNPDAFVNGNINLLMRGATLDLPSEEEVTELSSAQARELVAQQEAAFRIRSSLASSSTPLLAAESATDPANADSRNSNLSERASRDDEPEIADATVSRLEIVPASESDLASDDSGTGAVPGGEGSDAVEGNIREELARTEEALISAQQENVYLQERIAELEAQLGDSGSTSSEGLIADTELADLEERLESERAAAEQAVSASPEQEDSQVPTVVTSSSEESDRPWYSGPMTWIIMIVIVLAAVVGWIFNRRRSGEHYELAPEPILAPVSGLKDEAEDILRTLDSDSEESDEEADEEIEQTAGSADGPEEADDVEEQSAGHADDEHEESAEEEPEPEPEVVEETRQNYTDEQGDATVLDENSSDPEIQLDLARAYISMGDKEAARAILDEVLNLGNEEQQAEAREMMDQI